MGLRHLVRKFGPKWLVKDETNGVETDSRLLYTVALIQDALRERARLGVRARFPGAGAPADALAYIGRDRTIIRGPSEARGSYEVRLQRAIDDHRVRGNAWSLMEQIRGYCSPHAVRVRVVTEHGTFYTIDRDGTQSIHRGSSWNWDNSALSAAWGRYWLLIYPDNGLPWRECNPWGTPGDVWGEAGRTWGSTATIADVQSIRSICRSWKPAGRRCVKIVIVFDDAAFDPTDTAPPMPDGTWRTPATYVGGIKVPSRNARAIYWHGTGGLNG